MSNNPIAELNADGLSTGVAAAVVTLANALRVASDDRTAQAAALALAETVEALRRLKA